jgi:hypothetical protein
VGGAGKKLPRGGARHKSNSPRPTAAQGAGPLPHPVRLVSGQRFVPLGKRRQRTFTLTRVAADGTVRAVKEDGAKERIQLRAQRLLACDDRLVGIHYRFIGYRAGRRYRTYGYVVAIADDTATLVLPDWHPARTVRFPERLMPVVAPGLWLELSADLGQPRAGALNLADLRIRGEAPPKGCHQPDPELLRTLAGLG